MTNLTEKQAKTVEEIITRRLDAAVLDLNTKFEARLKIVEDENKNLREELENLKLERNQLPILKDWVGTINNGSQPKPKEQHLILNAVTKEKNEQRKRERNLIIFGTKSSKTEPAEIIEENKKIVNDILSEIGKSEVVPVYVKRLRAKNGENSGPIIVEFKEIYDRNSVLKSAKVLRTIEGYKKIYINPDLTESERIMDHELRTERNKLNGNLDQNSPFRFGIRGNDVVKIKKH